MQRFLFYRGQNTTQNIQFLFFRTRAAEQAT
jgi:hypothetical protein